MTKFLRIRAADPSKVQLARKNHVGEARWIVKFRYIQFCTYLRTINLWIIFEVEAI